jgi:ribosomal protein L10
MQKFRRGVPEKSSVYICKNSLMKEAVKTVPGWEVLSEQGCTVSNSTGLDSK